MSMKCSTCQVSLNSVGQYQQHLQGKTHAKKLRQLEGGGQPQAQSPAQPKSQNRGRGRGRPIVGGGGRGRGSLMRGGKNSPRGQGPINFIRAGSAQQQDVGQPGMQMGQPGMQMGQPGMQMGQAGMQVGMQPGQMPRVDPLLMNALNVAANPAAAGSTNMGYGGQQPSYGNSHGQQQQSFGNNRQQFSYQHRSQPFSKPKQPKQPQAQPQKSSSSSSEPIVLGDYMGMASVSIEGNDLLFCQICHVKLNSREQAEFHYRGTRHIKKARVARMAEVGALSSEKEGAEPGFFFCSFCNVTVNSTEQMTAHREGAKHKKLVELRKRKVGGQTEMEPAEKKASPDPTDSVPEVDPSDILPIDKMFPVTSSSTSATTETKSEVSCN